MMKKIAYVVYFNENLLGELEPNQILIEFEAFLSPDYIAPGEVCFWGNRLIENAKEDADAFKSTVLIAFEWPYYTKKRITPGMVKELVETNVSAINTTPPQIYLSLEEEVLRQYFAEDLYFLEKIEVDLNMEKLVSLWSKERDNVVINNLLLAL